MKRFSWTVAIGVNVLLAILVAFLYGKTQAPSMYFQPVQSTPSPSASPSPTPTPSPEPPYFLKPRIDTSHWVSWAILDVKQGIFAGSENWDQTNYLMSMIKPWIAADYFNQHQSPDDWTLSRLATMIVDSNDEVAYDYFGGQASLDRLTKQCGLTELRVRGWSWSLTEISARDAVRYGECIYDGKATTPQWTAWIVDKMRHVAGDGDFGPRELFPDRSVVATKNGWYPWEGQWYVNCLAVSGDWSISVLQRWPYDGTDLPTGISEADPICLSIASQLLRLSLN